jgi:hypothetical protein
VLYVDLFTGKHIAADKAGSGAFGETITETAVTVRGYVVVNGMTQEVTLNQNVSSVTFRYLLIWLIVVGWVAVILLLLAILFLL